MRGSRPVQKRVLDSSYVYPQAQEWYTRYHSNVSRVYKYAETF
jgi:hypothetical protein